jgi:excisionase family DNA binding protein
MELSAIETEKIASALWSQLEPRINAVLQPVNDAKDVLPVKAAAEYLGMSISTLYNKVHLGEIPHLPKVTRRVYFSKASLTEWISGRDKTAAQ